MASAWVKVQECDNCGRIYQPDDDGIYCLRKGCNGMLQEHWVSINVIGLKGWEKRRRDDTEE